MNVLCCEMFKEEILTDVYSILGRALFPPPLDPSGEVHARSKDTARGGGGG